MKRTPPLSLPTAGILCFLCACLLSCRPAPGRKDRISSVLILGNSIVQHGPAAGIGWQGNWGMAASVQDSDFVHLLIREIHKKDTAVQVKYLNGGSLEFNFGNYDFTRIDTLGQPDMLILRFAENVDDSQVQQGGFIRNYSEAIRRIDPRDKAVKVVVSGFWHRPNTNRLLEQYARDHHYIYVRNDDLLADSANAAWGRFTDAGVAAHPSDQGMRLIKDRIWEKIKDYF